MNPPRREGETYREYTTIYRPTAPGGYYRIVWMDPATGKRRERKGGRTLAEARSRADDLVAQLLSGFPPEAARSNQSATDAFRVYSSPDLHPGWGLREVESQQGRWRVHVDPIIGSKRCGQLRTADFERVFETLRDTTQPSGKPYSAGFMTLVYRQLKQWTKWLRDQSYTTTDLMTGVDLARYTPKQTTALDPQAPIVPRHLIPDRPAIAALVEALRAGKTPWWGLAAEIASTVGPRYGELAALNLDAIDLAAGKIWIRRNLSVVPKTADHPHGYELKVPKNRQLRGLPILASWRDELEQRVATVERDQRLGSNPDGLIFPGVRGRIYRNSNWHQGTWLPALERMEPGVWHDQWTWHGLRHAAATFLLHAPGMSDVVASAILGHATVSFTRDYYLGVESDYLDTAAAALDAALTGTTDHP